MIGKRLNNLSSNEQVFKEAIPPYQEARKQSGYTEILKFDASKKQPKKKQRKRNITYYNPPFNAASDVNLGKEFLNLLDKHFPKNNKRRDQLENVLTAKTSKLATVEQKMLQRSFQAIILKSFQTSEQKSKLKMSAYVIAKEELTTVL